MRALPQRPINPYGESKLAFEKILRWYDEIHGLRFVSLRYFNAAGASENFGEDHRRETHLIPNVLKVALGEKPHVEIYGTDYDTPDGTCIRDYIHILDLSRAHILALEAKRERLLQSRHRRRLERARSDRLLSQDHRKKNSGRGKTAASGRSAAPDRRVGKDQNANSAGSRNFNPRCDHRERLEMAPEIPARLRRLEWREPTELAKLLRRKRTLAPA